HQFARAWQHVAAIIIYAQAADPTVEDLNCVGPRTHLSGGILPDYGYQLAEQSVPDRRRTIHHLLSMNVVARAAALDHVARQRERSAAESNHWQARSEMLAYQAHSFSDVAEIGGPSATQALDTFHIPNRLFAD